MGVSAEDAKGGARESAQTSAAFRVELAGESDLAELAEVERRAASLFPDGSLPAGMENDALPLKLTKKAQAEGRLFVARPVDEDIVAGFVLVDEVDDQGHLAEIDVDPDWGRRGIGRALVARACEWGVARGYDQMFLTTFRELPWNAPFYAQLGFSEVEPSGRGPGLRAILAEEIRDGLDPEQRCAMVRSLI